MPDERIELVRRFMDAISRSDLDALLAETHPDAELTPLVSVWPRPYRGHDGLRQWWEDLQANWEEFAVEPEDFRAIDDSTLLVRIQWRARGRGGTPVIDGPAAVIFRFSEGKALAAHVFLDEARALRSLDPY